MSLSIPTNQPQPLTSLFPAFKGRVLYVGLDTGVDDGMALMQILASIKRPDNSASKVQLIGAIPTVGNAILPQTQINTARLLDLTKTTDTPLYPGAQAPLAIQGNSTAIALMEAQINATHFYGHDGLSDITGWPNTQVSLRKALGYQFAATEIMQATRETAITLISTSSLTELAQVFSELEKRDNQSSGAYARGIRAISIMGGCMSPKAGCNAPFGIPDDKKTSEANFFFDSPAAQQVFSVCQKYRIPILLSPLDLTQQTGLLWGAEQVDYLRSINNVVSNRAANFTAVVPYLDAPCFPNNSYPMHDLHSAAAILLPELYDVTRVSAHISDIGEVVVNDTTPLSDRFVYVLSMSPANQKLFYPRVLDGYNAFSEDSSQNMMQSALIVGAVFLAVLAFCATGSFVYKAATSCRSKLKQQQYISV